MPDETVSDETVSDEIVLDETILDETASAVLHKFVRLNRYLRQYARQMDDQGIRPRDFSVLRFLLESGPSTVGQVQEFLFRSASTASTVLSQMEEAGYVTRARSAEDNRVVIVELTEAGRELAQRAPMGGIPLLRRRLPQLSPAKLQQLDEALSEIMRLMEVTETE